jgi:hypothetical protein
LSVRCCTSRPISRAGPWIALLLAAGLCEPLRPTPIFVAVARAEGPAAAGDGLLAASDLDFLEARGLLLHDPARVRASLRGYDRRVASEGIALDRVTIASPQAMECVLARAVVRGATIVELFTEDVFLADRGRAVMVEDGALATLARSFDFHGAFPPQARLRDGHTARMIFLLVGQGRLLIGYDRGGTYDHPDREYAVQLLGRRLTGYDVSPFVRMEIGRDAGGRRTLSGLRVASGPDAALESFKGPGNFAIDGLTIDGSNMVAHALADTTIRPQPVSARIADPSRPARLEALGCPAHGPWRTAPATSSEISSEPSKRAHDTSSAHAASRKRRPTKRAGAAVPAPRPTPSPEDRRRPH